MNPSNLRVRSLLCGTNCFRKLPQHFPSPLPPLPIPPPHLPPALRTQPQAFRSPNLFNWYQVPRVLRLHVRRNHVDVFLRISLLPAFPRRMHRLHLIPAPIQPAGPLHLHPKHLPPVSRPNHKIVPLAVSPRQRQMKPHHLRLQQKCRLRNLSRPLRIPPQPRPPLLLWIRRRAHPRNQERTVIPTKRMDRRSRIHSCVEGPFVFPRPQLPFTFLHFHHPSPSAPHLLRHNPHRHSSFSAVTRRSLHTRIKFCADI